MSSDSRSPGTATRGARRERSVQVARIGAQPVAPTASHRVAQP